VLHIYIYIYDISRLRVNFSHQSFKATDFEVNKK